MKHSRILLICVGLLAALWGGAVRALPNVDEVQAAVQRGDHAGAEKMMREVVVAKPDSARAHYVLAEILAHQREYSAAAEHARRARALDPAIRFTDAARFNDFERLLQRRQGVAAPARSEAGAAAVAHAAPAAPAAESDGPPVWLLALGAVIVLALVVRWMRNRATVHAQPRMAGGYRPGYAGPGAAVHGAGMQAPPTAGGPGLMGMGLAAAGGVAAGMLAERMLRGDSHDTRELPPEAGAGSGLIPGAFDGGGFGDELARRDIDFGSGDGWDAGGADVGAGGDDW